MKIATIDLSKYEKGINPFIELVWREAINEEITEVFEVLSKIK